MVKKIFKVSGIVVGSVILFAGVVLGVMALMGKFKTPIVYPEVLSFGESVQLKDSDSYSHEAKLENGTNVKVYSLSLTGTSSKEDEVNRTTCYLRFVEGSEYITLCDVNGKAITRDSNGLYRVNCNSPIYYTINNIESTDEYYENENYGRVVLQARDEKGMVQTSGDTNLTLLIDKAVESIAFKTDFDNNYVDKTKTQSINVSINDIVYLDFVGSPQYSLKPISTKDKKDVEVYYYEQGVVQDLFKIDDVSYVNDIVKDFIHYDNSTGKYYFQSNVGGKSFNFRIGVFPTYSAKDKYDEENEGTSPSNLRRWQQMTHTDVFINVKNTNVEGVNLSSEILNMNLYSNNNVLTLNGTVGTESDNKLNLEFSYNPDNAQTQLRYNEADFTFTKTNVQFLEDDGDITALSNGEDETSETIKIEDINEHLSKTDNEYKWTYNDNDINITFSADINPINIGTTSAPIILIESISKTVNSTTTLCKCNNGALVAVLDGTIWKLKRLPAGTYLEFYTFNDIDEVTNTGNNAYTRWSKYAVEKITDTTGANKSWRITPQAEASNLNLGVVVVNNTGDYYFGSVKATLGKIDLNSEMLNFKQDREFNLNITYSSEDYSKQLPTLQISDIVTIPSEVTYQALALVTPEASSYNIEVCKNYVYTVNGQKYVLVGYFDENNNFVNEVKATTVTDPKNATQLYVIQLKGDYNETASDIIAKILKDSEIEEPEVGTLSDGGEETGTTEPVEPSEPEQSEKPENIISLKDYVTFAATGTYVNVSLNVNYDISLAIPLFEVDYGIRYSTEENADNSGVQNWSETGVAYVVGSRTIVLSIKAQEVAEGETPTARDIDTILKDISELYSEEELVKLFTSSNSNFIVTGVDVGESWNIKYEIEAYSDKPVNLVFEYAGNSYEFQKITILNNDPENIYYTYKYDDDNNEETPKVTETCVLYDSIDVAKVSSNYFGISIGYESSEYKYTYSINGHAIDTFSLNAISSSLGFNIMPEYATGTLIYEIANGENIAHILKQDENSDAEVVIDGVGTCYLKVTVGNVSRYIKIVVTAADEFEFIVTEDTIEVTNGTSYNVADTEDNNIKYTYTPENGTPVNLDDKIIIKDIEITNLNGNFVYSTDGVYEKIEGSEDKKIISVKDDGLTISRESVYQTSKLTLKVTISTITNGEGTFTLTFSPKVSLNFNYSDWEQTVYQGTTVLLYDLDNDVKTNSPLFNYINKNTEGEGTPILPTVKIEYYTEKEVDGETTYEYKEMSDAYNTNNYTWTPNNVGKYRITFSTSDSNIELGSHEINVIPNVVVVPKENVELIAGTAFNITQVLTAYAYNTSVVYGKFSETDTTIPMYNESYRSEFESTNYSNLTISSDAKNSLLLDEQYDEDEEDKLISADINTTIEHVELIGASVTETLEIKYSDYVLAENVVVTIKNPYSVENIGIETISILDLVNIPRVMLDSSEVADYKINSITAEGYTIEIVDNQFKITNHISDIAKDIEFTFTYKNSSDNKLTKVIVLDVIPYVPLKNTIEVYSGNSYNLVSEIFDVNFTDENREIDSITATSVEDENSVLESYSLNSNNSTFEVVINEIEGNKATVNITFKITYSTGEEYNYPYTLTILNRQSIEVQCPYNSDDFILTEMYFVKVQTNGTTITVSSEIDTISDKPMYEPIVTGETIDFNNRVTINNRDGSGDTNIASIEIYSCENISALKTYIAERCITINKGSVTFASKDTLGPTNLGIVKFKITTASGNYAYYYVRVYNKTGTNVTNQYFNGISSSTIQAIEITPDTNGIKAFNKNESGISLFDNGIGFNKAIDLEDYEIKQTGSNFDTSKIELYLMGSESISELTCENIKSEIIKIVDGEETRESIILSKYQKLNDITIYNVDNYITLNIALVYNHPQQARQFCFGILKVYVQPNGITVTTSLEKAEEGNNGKYVVDIATNVTSFANPFTVTGDTFKEASIITTGWDTEIADVDASGNVTFYKYVSEKTSFEVEYVYNNDLVLVVQFNMAEFELKTGTLTDVIEIGAPTFDSGTFTGFNNKYSLFDLVGDYRKSVNIKCGAITIHGYNLDSSGNWTEGKDFSIVCDSDGVPYLVFTQGISNKSVSITITYLNADDGTKTLTANFNVLEGIYIQETAVAVNSTLTKNYDSPIGSSITFTQSNTTDYCKTDVGNLKIYTSTDAILDITEKSTSGYLHSVDGLTANFVHMPVADKTIALQIKVKVGEYYYASGTTTLNVTLAQTYSMEATYVTVGAEKENVVGGTTYANSSSDLITKLFNTSCGYAIDIVKHTDENGDKRDIPIFDSYRISINDINGTLLIDKYNSMGFTESGNPNYIEFTKGSNMEYINGKLTFAEVTQNAQNNYLKITNLAGVDLDYNFYILTDEEQIYGENSSYVTTGANYASILLRKTEEVGSSSLNLPSNLTIGSLIDGDSKAFAISELIGKLTQITVDPDDGTKEISTSDIDFINNDVLKTNEDGTISYTIPVTGIKCNETENCTIDFILTLTTDKKITVNMVVKNASGEIIPHSELTSIGFNKIQLTFNLYGDSGIIETNYNILFYNYQTPTATGTISGGNVYSGNSIYMDKQITFKDADGSEVTGLAYNITSATVDGDEVGATSNNYYTFADDVITTISVPSSKNVIISFEVKDDDFVIATFNYTFTLDRGFNVVVNNTADFTDAPVKLNLPNSATMTDSDGDGDKDDLPAEVSTTYDSTKDYTNGKGLSIRVFDADVTEYSGNAGMNLSNLTIKVNETKNTLDTRGIAIEGKTIVFNKDFSGTLYLDITVNTGINGKYTTTLALDVTGYQTATYLYKAKENTIMLGENSNGYAAGSEITLIAQNKIENQNGIQLVNNTSTSITTTAKIDYVIVENYISGNSIDAVSLFGDRYDDDGNLIVDINSVVQTTNSSYTPFTINLPVNIPQSSADERIYALVVYRITLDYLTATYHGPYYVAYKVYNDKIISSDLTLVNVDETTYMSGTNLKVFNVSETYTTESGTYTAYAVLEGSTWVKKINGAKYELNIGSETTISINSGEVLTVISRELNNGSALLKFENSNMNAFIDLLNSSSVTLNNKSGMVEGLDNKATFSFVDLGSGVVGINLTDNGTLFNNELVADFKLGSAYTIENFTLTTSNKITPNSEMFISNIFTQAQLGADGANYYNESIIGIFSADSQLNNFVNVGSYSTVKEVCDITVDETIYKLYKITYTDGDKDIYNLSAEYYAVKSSTATIVLIDYANKGMGNTFIVEGNETTAKFDLLDDVIVIYSMVSDKIKATYINLTTGFSCADDDYDNGVITYTFTENDKETGYAEETYTINCNSFKLKLNLTFMYNSTE